MTTPAARERILRARRAALRERLIGTGMLPDLADGWIAHWESHGHDDRDHATIWDVGFQWIVAQHSGDRKPFDGKNPIES